MVAFNKLSVERLMLIGIGMTLAVVFLIAGMAWNIALPIASYSSVEHTREVVSQFDKLGSEINRAENGQLAYFLTKEKNFLAERDVAVTQLTSIIAQLRSLTIDNASQQARIAQMAALLDQRIQMLMASQAAFDAQGLSPVPGLFNSERDVSTHVRTLTAEATADEQQLLILRKGSELLRLKVMLVSIVLLLGFLLLLAVRVRGAVRGRSAMEQALQDGRQSLLKAEALQNAIFNSANFSVIATDAHGVIQIFNVGAEHMLGYQSIDVVNKITPSSISDEGEVIARAAALSAALETSISPGFEALVFKASRGIEDIYELTYIRKDGSRFPAIVSVTALRDESDRVIGYLLIGTDNTARKKVEAEQALLDQRLRDQQFYTRSLIESNIDALMATDLKGIISDVNQQMEALTGCTRDELIGVPFKNYFTDPERAEAAITRVLGEGKVTNYELTAHAKDGKETVVSYNATTFYDRDRNLQGVFAAARDVTERKQFEHTLQENNVELENARAAAEKANLAKSEFLSSMSHELRTPLNAVLGFAQLMESETPSPTPAQKLSIDQILQAGWYLLRLINEILDLAMIESGKVTMSHESMSLTDVLQDCRSMMETQAQKRHIQMTFPDVENLFYVHADRTRVKQVLINLLSNAIKYNRDYGAVIVQCQLNGENRIRVSVRDTGTGLAPDQLSQLFQPFNRLGKESGGEEGTGIGLVVTKQLVELMGGTIGVDSTVGVGCTFWFELAASSAPKLVFGEMGEGSRVAPAPESLVYDATPVQRTLLYVEDNPANMALIKQLIERRKDLKLLTATDAHLGIQLTRTYQPDVILMDINLPGLSGYGALKILHEDPGTAHIPVMALSANAIPRDIENGLKAGFFRYLTKPIKVNEFMDSLDIALHYAAEHRPSSKRSDLLRSDS
ncbi:PAS domain S-box protein [Undibacterium sp. Rencai35W]|uniref:PAS domain S-box protein n=1 Tax=Undibacterium sp. Rencai35W TaxID=3413046 RepID=UPI003BF11CD9